MREPVGFFITWTCYGCWLHGDERGSVDDQHNVFGTPILPKQYRRKIAVREQLTHEPVRLNSEARSCVALTISDHANKRDWELLAVNVRSNHVHVVIRFADISPEKMMGEWKAWSTRRLRASGLIIAGRPVWTRHGSTRYLWDEREIEPTVDYVMEGQGASRFGGSAL